MRVLAGLLALCLAMTALLDPRAQAAPADLGVSQASENMVIRIDGDRLTVNLKDADLAAVLTEIGRHGHIDVIIQGSLRKTVSLEFQQIQMEEGLRRLLRGCGWMTVASRNGAIQQLVVAETPDGLTRGTPRGPAFFRPPAPPSGPDGRPNSVEQHPREPVRAVAALMEREAVKTFFDLRAHSPDDSAAMLDAFAKVVESLSLEDVGDLVGILKDKTMPPSKWEEVLAPLADILPAQERTALVRSLHDRSVRDVVLKSFEQVRLFKLAQAREALEEARR